jgi:hypothetical protein
MNWIANPPLLGKGFVMFSPIPRRNFVSGSLKASALAALGDFSFLNQLPHLSAAQVQVPRSVVQLSADMEPLVRLIEETARDRLLETIAQRVRQGTSYQQLLSALMLAGVRGIRPRPVGFKFHAVLVVNSAHLASLAAQDQDRWLPLFWAMDNYKSSQARNRQEGDWVMPPVEEGQLPDAAHAATRFREAMDDWDEAGADRAIAAWARTAGCNEIYEAFFRYGARDFRDIGHKAIFVANSYRTLQTIGWRHAEPILRSLAFALLEHEGTNPAQRDDEKDRPWRDNLRHATRIRADWQRGRVSADASRDLLGTLRTANPAEASERVVAMLNQQTDPASLWDGLFLTAGELLMRQPGIVGLHCVTTANALHFIYQNSSNDETRRLMLLQAAAFLPMFRQVMIGRSGRLREDLRIDTLEAAPVAERAPQAVEEIFAEVTRDRLAAARKTLAFLEANGENAQLLMAAARRLTFTKGNDSHDYKFSSAALEDFYHTTPALRPRFLASSMFHLRGSGDRNNNLIQRTQAALGS